MSETCDWAARIEAAVLDAAVAAAPRLGWTNRLVDSAARSAGLSAAEGELLLPNGPRDLAALLARRHDARALERLGGVDPAALKVRERIRLGVLARCEAALDDEAAVRRWSGFLVLPPNAALGLRLAWASADVLWRWAGDVAADENHYTKRTLLAEILISTLAIRLAAGAGAAETHLDGRIAAVMAFERWKAGFSPMGAAEGLARTLGRWRYGAAGDEPGPIAANGSTASVPAGSAG